MSVRKFLLARVVGLGTLGAVCVLSSCVQAPAPDRLTIALPYEATTLDPHATSTLSNLAILLNSYETLVSSDAEMRLSPSLAQRWENPDLETWVFHLRPNVRFHSGKILDSRDVVFSFERLLHRSDLKMSGYLIYIQSVEAVDPMTVRIRTTRPLSILLNKMSYVAIVPSGSTDAGLAANEDGTGPYRIRRSRPGAIEFERNDRYWGPRPFAREVTLRLGIEPPQALQLVQSRRANLVQCDLRGASFGKESLKHFRAVRQPNVYVGHLAYDLGREFTPGVPGIRNPFRDIRVRRAIDMAIDRDELVAALAVPATPASQLTPPFIFGFNPSIAAAHLDRAQAVQLLSQAGFPRGFDLRLDVRQLFESAARNVAAQLARVNIRTDLRVHSEVEFDSLDDRHMISLSLEEFGCTTGDISDIFDNVVHSADAPRHFGIFNTVGYSNPDLDRLIEESDAIADPATRRDRLQKINARAMDDLVLIPLYVDEDIFAVDRSLSWRPRNDGMVLAADIQPSGPGSL